MLEKIAIGLPDTYTAAPHTPETEMPLLNVKLCAPPSPETTAKVAAALTDLTVEILKKKRELTAVAVEYLPPSQWFLGGVALAAQSLCSFSLEIKVTEGTNSKNEKAAYISQVFAAMEKIIGPSVPASYIVIHDIQGDSWGYQGQTQEFRAEKGRGL
jgi:4-oxalocrotonate tautomerase